MKDSPASAAAAAAGSRRRPSGGGSGRRGREWAAPGARVRAGAPSRAQPVARGARRSERPRLD